MSEGIKSTMSGETAVIPNTGGGPPAIAANIAVPSSSQASAERATPEVSSSIGSRSSQSSSRTPRKNNPNDYYFGRIIGEGSFSTVYLVKDKETNKEMAIKVCEKSHIIREKKQQAILREKKILCKLKDNTNPRAPFFVNLHSSFQDHASLYFVVSYAKFGDFFNFLKLFGVMPLDVIQFYSGEMVQALEHLHKIGIAHRDLKPENILLGRGGHILLTDFGSAKIIDSDKEPEEPQEQGDNEEEGKKPLQKSRSSFVGTAEYVSPEILSGKASDPPADLWALGCIVYQMAVGRPPFQSGSEYLIFQKIQKLDYTIPPTVNPEVKSLVEGLLKLEPSERLGAGDLAKHGAYTSIKSHKEGYAETIAKLFSGVDFDNLFRTPPPVSASQLWIPIDEDPVWAKYPNMTTGLGPENRTRLLKASIDCEDDTESEDDGQDEIDGPPLDYEILNSPSQSIMPDLGSLKEITPSQREKWLLEQKQNNEYHRFVEDNLILKQGILDKKKGLWSRRRMFLLTEGPRLFYVDPKDMSLKGEIPLSAETKVEMKSFKIFFVHTPGRTYFLIDPTSYATQWCDAIEKIIHHYFRS